MANWYKSDPESYLGIAHPDSLEEREDKWGDIYLWFYSPKYKKMQVIKQTDKLEKHVNLFDPNDLYPASSIQGRYSRKQNISSLETGAGSVEDVIRCVFELEKLASGPLNIFVSGNIEGKSFNSTINSKQLIKQLHQLGLRYASKRKYPDSLNQKIWNMFGVNLNTGEYKSYPKKNPKQNEEDCKCHHSMDMHCDGGDDGW